MTTRIHERTDCHWPDAEKRLWLDRRPLGNYGLSDEDRARILALPPIEPGNCWPIRWSSTGALAGYAIVCPRCREVHTWTTAQNCGVNVVNDACEHRRLGTGSCWEWSGSLMNGTLTANPSLQNDDPDCGWHGWLRAGELTEA